VLAATGSETVDSTGWPTADRLIPHYRRYWHPAGFVTPLPEDTGVLAGDVSAVEHVDVDAVISLCRMGVSDVPADREHVEVWLIDSEDVTLNPHLAFVLRDIASTIGALRDEGKRVFVHCVHAESRTPAAAAAYLCLRHGFSGADALSRTDTLIPGPGPNRTFRRTLLEMFPGRRGVG
jgi:hypothetical protein